MSFGSPIQNLRMSGAMIGGVFNSPQAKAATERQLAADANLSRRLQNIPDGFARVKRVQNISMAIALLIGIGGFPAAIVLPYFLADSFSAGLIVFIITIFFAMVAMVSIALVGKHIASSIADQLEESGKQKNGS